MSLRFLKPQEPRLSRRPGISVRRIAQAVAIVFALSWCVAAASTIPTITEDGRTLVAVEPLLQSLQIGYDIEGTTLDVDGRTFPQALVLRDGRDMAEAYALANFLHLTITKRDGVLVFSTPAQPVDDASPAPPADLSLLRARLIAALNAHRGDAGLPPLQDDPIADQAAQYQALDMAVARTMRHEDALGRTPLQRYSSMGGRAAWYAENVGWYGLDLTGDTALWGAISKLDADMMAEQPPDDGHRQNILGTQYAAVGIGITTGASGVYIAEDFVGH